MSNLTKATYQFNAIPVKIPKPFFTEPEQKKNLKIHIEAQKTLDSQSNPKQKNNADVTLHDFKLCCWITVVKQHDTHIIQT